MLVSGRVKITASSSLKSSNSDAVDSPRGLFETWVILDTHGLSLSDEPTESIGLNGDPSDNPR